MEKEDSKVVYAVLGTLLVVIVGYLVYGVILDKGKAEGRKEALNTVIQSVRLNGEVGFNLNDGNTLILVEKIKQASSTE